MMDRFDFLLGEWNLEYKVPKSVFSEKATGTGTGTGTFKRALDNQYVYFDYSAIVNGKKGQAHGIFGWDEKEKIIRYWWFENSGKFMTATCNFIDKKTLFMNWHDTLLIQTFKKLNQSKVVLRMENPNSESTYELILEVILTKK